MPRYGCLMAPLPRWKCSHLAGWARGHVDPSHLHGDGLENWFHVTIKYGFEDSPFVLGQLREFLRKCSPFTIQVKGLSYFPDSGDGDVLKLDCEGPDLRALNKALSEQFQCHDTHPVYKPHLTLAYLSRGQGKKYAKFPGPDGFTFPVGEVVYSDVRGMKTPISLLGGSLTMAKSLDKVDEDTRRTYGLTEAEAEEVLNQYPMTRESAIREARLGHEDAVRRRLGRAVRNRDLGGPYSDEFRVTNAGRMALDQELDRLETEGKSQEGSNLGSMPYPPKKQPPPAPTEPSESELVGRGEKLGKEDLDTLISDPAIGMDLDEARRRAQRLTEMATGDHEVDVESNFPDTGAPYDNTPRTGIMNRLYNRRRRYLRERDQAQGGKSLGPADAPEVPTRTARYVQDLARLDATYHHQNPDHQGAEGEHFVYTNPSSMFYHPYLEQAYRQTYRRHRNLLTQEAQGKAIGLGGEEIPDETPGERDLRRYGIDKMEADEYAENPYDYAPERTPERTPRSSATASAQENAGTQYRFRDDPVLPEDMADRDHVRRARTYRMIYDNVRDQMDQEGKTLSYLDSSSGGALVAPPEFMGGIKPSPFRRPRPALLDEKIGRWVELRRAKGRDQTVETPDMESYRRHGVGRAQLEAGDRVAARRVARAIQLRGRAMSDEELEAHTAGEIYSTEAGRQAFMRAYRKYRDDPHGTPGGDDKGMKSREEPSHTEKAVMDAINHHMRQQGHPGNVVELQNWNDDTQPQARENLAPQWRTRRSDSGKPRAKAQGDLGSMPYPPKKPPEAPQEDTYAHKVRRGEAMDKVDLDEAFASGEMSPEEVADLTAAIVRGADQHHEGAGDTNYRFPLESVGDLGLFVGPRSRAGNRLYNNRRDYLRARDQAQGKAMSRQEYLKRRAEQGLPAPTEEEEAPKETISERAIREYGIDKVTADTAATRSNVPGVDWSMMQAQDSTEMRLYSHAYGHRFRGRPLTVADLQGIAEEEGLTPEQTLERTEEANARRMRYDNIKDELQGKALDPYRATEIEELAKRHLDSDRKYHTSQGQELPDDPDDALSSMARQVEPSRGFSDEEMAHYVESYKRHRASGKGMEHDPPPLTPDEREASGWNPQYGTAEYMKFRMDTLDAMAHDRATDPENPQPYGQRYSERDLTSPYAFWDTLYSRQRFNDYMDQIEGDEPQGKAQDIGGEELPEPVGNRDLRQHGIDKLDMDTANITPEDLQREELYPASMAWIDENARRFAESQVQLGISPDFRHGGVAFDPKRVPLRERYRRVRYNRHMDDIQGKALEYPPKQPPQPDPDEDLRSLTGDEQMAHYGMDKVGLVQYLHYSGNSGLARLARHYAERSHDTSDSETRACRFRTDPVYASRALEGDHGPESGRAYRLLYDSHKDHLERQARQQQRGTQGKAQDDAPSDSGSRYRAEHSGLDKTDLDVSGYLGASDARYMGAVPYPEEAVASGMSPEDDDLDPEDLTPEVLERSRAYMRGYNHRLSQGKSQDDTPPPLTPDEISQEAYNTEGARRRKLDLAYRDHTAHDVANYGQLFFPGGDAPEEMPRLTEEEIEAMGADQANLTNYYRSRYNTHRAHRGHEGKALSDDTPSAEEYQKRTGGMTSEEMLHHYGIDKVGLARYMHNNPFAPHGVLQEAERHHKADVERGVFPGYRFRDNPENMVTATDPENAQMFDRAYAMIYDTHRDRLYAAHQDEQRRKAGQGQDKLQGKANGEPEPPEVPEVPVSPPTEDDYELDIRVWASGGTIPGQTMYENDPPGYMGRLQTNANPGWMTEEEEEELNYGTEDPGEEERSPYYYEPKPRGKAVQPMTPDEYDDMLDLPEEEVDWALVDQKLNMEDYNMMRTAGQGYAYQQSISSNPAYQQARYPYEAVHGDALNSYVRAHNQAYNERADELAQGKAQESEDSPLGSMPYPAKKPKEPETPKETGDQKYRREHGGASKVDLDEVQVDGHIPHLVVQLAHAIAEENRDVYGETQRRTMEQAGGNTPAWNRTFTDAYNYRMDELDPPQTQGKAIGLGGEELPDETPGERDRRQHGLSKIGMDTAGVTPQELSDPEIREQIERSRGQGRYYAGLYSPTQFLDYERDEQLPPMARAHGVAGYEGWNEVMAERQRQLGESQGKAMNNRPVVTAMEVDLAAQAPRTGLLHRDKPPETAEQSTLRARAEREANPGTPSRSIMLEDSEGYPPHTRFRLQERRRMADEPSEVHEDGKAFDSDPPPLTDDEVDFTYEDYDQFYDGQAASVDLKEEMEYRDDSAFLDAEQNLREGRRGRYTEHGLTRKDRDDMTRYEKERYNVHRDRLESEGKAVQPMTPDEEQYFNQAVDNGEAGSEYQRLVEQGGKLHNVPYWYYRHHGAWLRNHGHIEDDEAGDVNRRPESLAVIQSYFDGVPTVKGKAAGDPPQEFPDYPETPQLPGSTGAQSWANGFELGPDIVDGEPEVTGEPFHQPYPYDSILHRLDHPDYGTEDPGEEERSEHYYEPKGKANGDPPDEPEEPEPEPPVPDDQSLGYQIWANGNFIAQDDEGRLVPGHAIGWSTSLGMTRGSESEGWDDPGDDTPSPTHYEVPRRKAMSDDQYRREHHGLSKMERDWASQADNEEIGNHERLRTYLKHHYPEHAVQVDAHVDDMLEEHGEDFGNDYAPLHRYRAVFDHVLAEVADGEDDWDDDEEGSYVPYQGPQGKAIDKVQADTEDHFAKQVLDEEGPMALDAAMDEFIIRGVEPDDGATLLRLTYNYNQHMNRQAQGKAINKVHADVAHQYGRSAAALDEAVSHPPLGPNSPQMVARFNYLRNSMAAEHGMTPEEAREVNPHLVQGYYARRQGKALDVSGDELPDPPMDHDMRERGITKMDLDDSQFYDTPFGAESFLEARRLSHENNRRYPELVGEGYDPATFSTYELEGKALDDGPNPPNNDTIPTPSASELRNPTPQEPEPPRPYDVNEHLQESQYGRYVPHPLRDAGRVYEPNSPTNFNDHHARAGYDPHADPSPERRAHLAQAPTQEQYEDTRRYIIDDRRDDLYDEYYNQLIQNQHDDYLDEYGELNEEALNDDAMIQAHEDSQDEDHIDNEYSRGVHNGLPRYYLHRDPDFTALHAHLDKYPTDRDHQQMMNDWLEERGLDRFKYYFDEDPDHPRGKALEIV